MGIFAGVVCRWMDLRCWEGFKIRGDGSLKYPKDDGCWKSIVDISGRLDGKALYLAGRTGIFSAD
jgi:hypothetical protein